MLLNRENLQIALDARDDGRFAMDEFLARDLFIHLNIAARHLFYKVEWCVGKRRVLVRIAVLPEPQPEEFLVEILRLLSRTDARFVASELPVSGRIRRMYLVDEHEISFFISTKFVFRINEDESALRGDFLPARKERERRSLHLMQ